MMKEIYSEKIHQSTRGGMMNREGRKRGRETFCLV